MKNILKTLAFTITVKGPDRLSVTAPAFRNDIKAAVDMAEELARVIGYDRVPSSLPHIRPSTIATNPQYILKKKLREVLTGLGLNEVISYPLISQLSIEKSFMQELPRLKVKNPLSLDQEYLRPALLPAMLSVVLLNFNRGQRDLRLFEIGKAYFVDGEKETLGVILSGSRGHDWRQSQKETFDFYDLKGILQSVLRSVGLPLVEITPGSQKIYAPRQSAEVFVEGVAVGRLGKVHKNILKNWDIKSEDVFYAEICLSTVLQKRNTLKHFKPLTGFPSITRDVSIAVAQDIPYERVETLVRRSGGDVLSGIIFREQYLGEKIASGLKGFVFSLSYQASDRTLTDSEIHPHHEKILKALTQDLGAVIR